MKQLQLSAYAKFNWFLRVGSRRDDGFHEVVTLLQSIDLHDLLELQVRADGQIRLTLEGIAVPAGDDNLVVRAARLLRDAAGGAGADLRLSKRIPPGAGLGGGSSDAAAALAGLNLLWKADLNRAELAEMGAQLGSDVPFFLFGGTALGTGRGETIEPVEDLHTGLSLLLVLPGFEMPTAEVYRRYEAATAAELTSPESDTRIPTLLAAVRESRWDQLPNDLESAAFSLRPELREIRDRIRSVGADVLLGGSGSTLVVLGGEAALTAVESRCRGMANLTTQRTRVLSRRDLPSRR